MTLRRTLLLLALAPGLGLGTACREPEPGGGDGGDPDPGMTPGPGVGDESFLPLESRISQEGAEAALRLANRATREELAVVLSAPVAAAIDDYRLGPDGAFDTADDRSIDDLGGLDAIPGVGRETFYQLVQLADREGFRVAPACTSLAPRPVAAKLYTTPDDGQTPILELISGARRSVDLVMYQLRSDVVVSALEAAAGRGVRVRVILDRQQNDNEGLVSRLSGRGLQARLSSDTFVYTHPKTLIIDRRRALVSSGNFSGTTGRDHGVIGRDWQDLDDLLELFNADWYGRAPDVSCTRLVVAPQNARDRVLEVIDLARHTLDVEAVYVSDHEVIDAIERAHGRGVAVRVLMNDPAYGFSDGSVGRQLAALGIPSRHSQRPFFIHSKTLIADGEWAFIGSENFSRNSLDRNREVGLVMNAGDFELTRLATLFETDWATSVSF
jgi:phosphatidylserine/phosphatidylglycerophosphate/cardiolipin synthase-like enzyme